MEFAQKVRPAPRGWRSVSRATTNGSTARCTWAERTARWPRTSSFANRPGQVSEPERLEVLVHELGHFLGAAHTSDKASVMRPKLGDRQSAAKTFRIGFDAPNTLIMSLIAEEMRTRHIWHPSVLSPEAKTAVRGAYMALAQTIPQDPVSTSAIESLGPPPPPARPARQPEPGDHQRRTARRCRPSSRRPARTRNCPSPPKTRGPRSGGPTTSLTVYYVRRAAAAARQLPPQVGPPAFLLGLGVALDDSNFVRDKAALNEVWQKIEPDDQRQTRLLILGTPTMLKRQQPDPAFHDLLGPGRAQRPSRRRSGRPGPARSSTPAAATASVSPISAPTWRA